MSIGNNIKKLREKYGLSQKQIADIAGVSDKAVSTWENNLKEPRMGAVQKIADHFNLQKSNLIEENGLDISFSIDVTPVTDIVQLPIVATIRAGYNGQAIEERLGMEPAYGISNPQECVWFKVKGDSMSPDIKNGDFALVRQQPEVENGDLAVVIYDGELGTIKKFQHHGNAVSLVPINPAYETKVIVGEDLRQLIVYGKVIEIKRKF
ncbi:helix-turn-helix domain-containing protein [Christensenellaceae bacterium OttesenSCG-928-K19]|nr:helix-turn-helix domain-containing protein [Christensenellaceae bacterium OttesenSCG-928-K19]